MNKKIWKKFLALAMMAGCSSVSYAQLEGSVSIEGNFDPLIIETERLNTFPQSYRFDLPAANLEYEMTGIVTDFRPRLFTMGVTGRQTDFPGRRRRGFVDFRLGSYLNSRLHAGYNIIADSVSTLSADLKFQSSVLYRPHGVPDSYTRMPRKRLYDGQLGLDYSRVFDSEGLLNAHASYRLGYFNYYGTTVEKALLPDGMYRPDIPSQTVNQADAYVSYSSSPSFIRGWHAEGGVNFLSYRRLYGPVLPGDASKGEKETHLKLGGGYAFPFIESGALAVDARGDFLFYPEKDPSAIGLTDYSRKNYGVIAIKPSFRFASQGLSIKAGVDLALSYNAMGKENGSSFGAFHAAPDVAIDYKKPGGPVGIFLDATGGVTPSTLAMLEKFDRYQMPWLLTTRPLFSPIDARVGVNAGPFAGFSGEVAFRYAVGRNVPLGGWYQDYLGTYLRRSFTLDIPLYLDPYSHTVDLHGFSLDLKLRYALGTMVEVKFDGSYTPQHGSKGIFNGYDRPRWLLSLNAGVRPIKKLKIEAGYDYRGVRNCYALAPGTKGENRLTPYRLPDLTDLNAKVTYSLLDNLDIYCKGENLLNSRTTLLPGLQSEGIAIYGGFYLEF